MSDTVEKSVAASPGENDQELDIIKEKITQYQKNGEQSHLGIGRLLLEVKRIKPHGQWIPWIKENTDLSVCKAQRLMRVAAWMDENEAPVPHLDFTKAYILSRLPQKELKYFLEKNQIEGMAKRELEDKVREYLQSRSGKPSAVPGPEPTATHVSAKNDLLDRFNRIKKDVSELAGLVGNDSSEYDIFATDLCELCQSIVQQFSPEGLEDC